MKISKNIEPIVSGISAALVIGVLAFLTLRTSSGIWLMFSFGATVFIVFVLYNLETAQPKNIFFGHLVSVLVGIIFNEIIGFSFYSLGLAIPFILSGYYMTIFLNSKKGFSKHYSKVKKGGGIILLITGVLILTNSIQVISYYILTTFPFLTKLG